MSLEFLDTEVGSFTFLEMYFGSLTSLEMWRLGAWSFWKWRLGAWIFSSWEGSQGLWVSRNQIVLWSFEFLERSGKSMLTNTLDPSYLASLFLTFNWSARWNVCESHLQNLAYVRYHKMSHIQHFEISHAIYLKISCTVFWASYRAVSSIYTLSSSPTSSHILPL